VPESARWLKRFAIALGALVIVTGVVASSPYSGHLGVVARIPGRDVTVHFVLMGLLTFFAVLGFASSRIAGRRLGILGCTALVVAFVTIDEFVQLLVPSRAFSLVDLSASYAGVATFATLAWGILRARAS